MSLVDSGYPAAHQNNFSLPRRPVPHPAIQQTQQQALQEPSQYTRTASHGHSRSASSGIFPNMPQNPQQQQQPAYPPQQPQQQPQQPSPPPRRTYSSATSSTNSASGGVVPQRRNSGTSSLARSTSSRSGSSPTSYVALMRKQKATVWSDRAQFEDPRMQAQQRAAKMRAAMEVSGHHSNRASTSGSSSITGGVRAKIRHHGVTKAREYTPMTHPASGVPMRLSAREVDDDDSEDEYLAARAQHQRSGSGRSSLGSGRMSSAYGMQQQGLAMTGRSSESSTPPQTRGNDTPESPGGNRPRAETQSTINSKGGPTPVPQHYRGEDYFAQRYVGEEATSGNSGDSGETDEAQFGGVGGLPKRVEPNASSKADSDLSRRGSVDDRTATMSGYKRLYIANPDADSD